MRKISKYDLMFRDIELLYPKLILLGFANKPDKPGDSRWLILLKKYMRNDISIDELAELERKKKSDFYYQDQFDRFTDPRRLLEEMHAQYRRELLFKYSIDFISADELESLKNMVAKGLLTIKEI